MLSERLRCPRIKGRQRHFLPRAAGWNLLPFLPKTEVLRVFSVSYDEKSFPTRSLLVLCGLVLPPQLGSVPEPL